jgi:quinol monooxygenase YgiN
MVVMWRAERNLFSASLISQVTPFVWRCIFCYSTMMTASFAIAQLGLLVLLLDSSNSFSTKSSSPLLALNLKCTVKPNLRDNWLTAIQEDQQCTRLTEPNNLQFVIGQDIDDPNTFYLHEEFANISAFQDHLDTPHFAKYNEFVKSEDPFVGQVDMCFYHPREEDEDALVQKKRSIHKESFGLNVNLYPKASVRDEFLRVISDNKKGTDTTEELALQYTYGESISVEGFAEGAANTFHFHEQYTGKDHGKEGFDIHASMPHFAAWEEFVTTDPFEKNPEVFFFKIIED